MEDRKARRRSLIFLALVLVGFTIYYFVVGQSAPVFRFSAQQRTVGFSGMKGTSCLFSLDDLEEFSLYTGGSPDWGQPLTGGAGQEGGTGLGGVHYGTWHSDTIGEYQAYVTERITNYILLRDGEKTAIFNSDNNETTRSVYEQLIKFMDETKQ